MTPADLKYHVTATGSCFFERFTMRHFGDTMSNYGCRSARILTSAGEEVEVWELYRRRPVKHGLQTSAYFRKSDYSRTWKA